MLGSAGPRLSAAAKQRLPGPAPGNFSAGHTPSHAMPQVVPHSSAAAAGSAAPLGSTAEGLSERLSAAEAAEAFLESLGGQASANLAAGATPAASL